MTVQERFWKYAIKGAANECWVWRASLDRKGYGQLIATVGGVKRNLRAHRIACEIAHGPIPDGLVVMHSCDNPACVNPGHLRLGTMRDNTEDMMRKGRDNHGRLPGSQNPMSKFTEQEVAEMRSWQKSGAKSIAQMAAEHGVTYQAVYYAIYKGWKHV